jgi:hypothetical protein
MSGAISYRITTGMHYCVAISLLLITTIYSVTSQSFEDDHVRSMIYINYLHDITAQVYVADFGDPQEYPTRFNLMYPPIDDNGYLCTLPPSFESLEIEESSYNFMTTGFLVKSGGNCTAQAKAEILLEIQKFYPYVQFLLIYNTTTSDPLDKEAPTILLPDFYPVPNKFKRLTILSINTYDANKIMEEIDITTSQLNTSAYFLSKTWTFNFYVSGLPDRDFKNPSPNDDSPVNFFWFRFVLFGLLIIAPCFRALYLWYVGGGRIYFRRNDRGRIIGLQYIPPVSSWLAIGGGRLQQPATPIQNTITEDEFANLPEIIYSDPGTSSQHDDSGETPSIIVEPKVQSSLRNNGPDELDALNTSFTSAAENGIVGVVESNAALCIDNQKSGNDNDIAIPSIESNEISNIVPEDRHIVPNTTCTTCSICIDDFIPGETLTLLPRFVEQLIFFKN